MKDKWVSKKDLMIMMEISNSSISCRSETDFKMLLEQFFCLVPFDKWVFGEIDLKYLFTKFPMGRVSNVNYPSEFFDVFMKEKYYIYDILHQRFFQSFEIQHFAELESQYNEVPNNPLIELYLDYGIKDTFLFGTADLFQGRVLSFVFSSKEKIEDIIRYKIIIEYLVPHLSEAFKRLPYLKSAINMSALTQMETEVIKWLKEGKTSWEISMILNKSESAINYHVENIIKKTDSLTRTQAVIKALQYNLLATQTLS